MRNLALQSTLDTLSEGACLFDSNRSLQAWNGELADMLGSIAVYSRPSPRMRHSPRIVLMRVDSTARKQSSGGKGAGRGSAPTA